MSDRKRTTIPSDSDAELLARASLYRLVARLFVDPVQGPMAGVEDVRAAEAAARYLGDARACDLVAATASELPRDTDAARVAYTTMFGLMVSPECPPYETEFQERTDIFWRTTFLADIVGFYRAFELELSGRERPDHVAIEAEFLWYLLERMVGARLRGHDAERSAILESAFRSFFTEHFGAWVASFANTAVSHARLRDVPFYARAAALLAHIVQVDGRRLAFHAPATRRPLVVEMPSPDACDGCAVTAGVGEPGPSSSDLVTNPGRF